MKPILKIIISAAAAVIVACFIFLFTYYLKPDSDIVKNRQKLTVSPASQAGEAVNAVHFLPTGSSDAILLESDGHFALVDCAEDSDNPRVFPELV
jgi:hypothetical protein